jgi:hypothetical protein
MERRRISLAHAPRKMNCCYIAVTGRNEQRVIQSSLPQSGFLDSPDCQVGGFVKDLEADGGNPAPRARDLHGAHAGSDYSTVTDLARLRG